MPGTYTGTLADTIPIVIEEAKFTEQYAAVIAKLCWRITKAKGKGSTVNLPYFGTVTANELTEGVDMTNPQAMGDTNVRFTPAEVGAQIMLSYKLERDDQEDVRRAGGRILGACMAAKQEGDLAGQFDDGTKSLGSTTSTLTLGHLAAAYSLLSGVTLANGGPAPKPYAVVHHPFVLLDLVDVLTPTIAGGIAPLAAVGQGIAEETLREYIMGRVFGMNVYASGNVAISSSAAKGGVFATGRGGGLVLVTAKEWDIIPDDDPSMRAVELNIVGEYAVGEYLPGWIVELSNDATDPD